MERASIQYLKLFLLVHVLVCNALEKSQEGKTTVSRSTLFEYPPYDYVSKTIPKEPVYQNYEDEYWTTKLGLQRTPQLQEKDSFVDSGLDPTRALFSYLNQFSPPEMIKRQDTPRPVPTPKPKKTEISRSPEDPSIQKKSHQCCGRNLRKWCQPCPTVQVDGKGVTRSYLEWYTAMPLAMINLTRRMPSLIDQCENLTVQTFPTDLRMFPRLSPDWIADAKILGNCPSTLTRRHLGNTVIPSHVVELLCLCKKGLCSNRGAEFLCTEVTHPITIWRVETPNTYSQDIVSVTVGCICAHKPAPFAGNFNDRYIT